MVNETINPAETEIPKQRIEIPTAKGRVVAYAFRPLVQAEKNAAVLFINGWKSAQDRSFGFAESVAREGFVGFTFDMYGHGESEGKTQDLTMEDFLESAMVAYDRLVTLEKVDPEKISVVGASMGAYIAALLSRKRPVENLAFRAPADYMDENFSVLGGPEKIDMPTLKQWRSNPRDFNSSMALKAVHEFRGHVLVVESGKDTVVPKQTVEAFGNAVVDQTKVDYQVMPEAPHSLTGHEDFRKDFCNILNTWLKRS